MDNVSQLSAVAEYVLAGGASTELEKLIPGKTGIIFQISLDRDLKDVPQASTMVLFHIGN